MPIKIPRPCDTHDQPDWLKCVDCWLEMLKANGYQGWTNDEDLG